MIMALCAHVRVPIDTYIAMAVLGTLYVNLTTYVAMYVSACGVCAQ